MIKLFLCAVSASFLWSAALSAAIANTVSATIGVGVTPDGLAVTPDSLFAYVANSNNYVIPGADTGKRIKSNNEHRSNHHF